MYSADYPYPEPERPAEIEPADIEMVRHMNPGQSNLALLPIDWPEWARMDLQTIANHRQHHQTHPRL